MTAIVIIPARYDSTRFPGKPLSLLRGRPIIQHVYENSRLSKLADDVIVATDSETIFEKVLSFGGKAIMTNRAHPSGTDRVAEVATSVDFDIIVNMQADEPLIKPQMIDDVITILEDRRASIGTIIKKIEDPREISDPNIVKVVFDKDWFALYFSRTAIPYRAPHSSHLINHFYKHIGLYSYRKEVLVELAGMDQTRLEQIEKLEQLRALENGMKIKLKETFFETYGVDTPEDLERVEKCLSTSL
ncbi:MAG: 3-deoxy-manno-octulosonate cytidylyltransferase [Nitrospirota bacterium]